MSPSTFTVFARKVKNSGWSKRHIKRKFLKQVQVSDYAKEDTFEILNWLHLFANPLSLHKKR